MRSSWATSGAALTAASCSCPILILYWIGFKLNEEQKGAIRHLTDESFQTLMRLSEETGLSTRELEEAVDHPRARLRHLGVIKYDYRSRDN